MIQGDPGPSTEKTDRNIAQARSHRLRLGRYHVEWKAYTGQFHLRPRWHTANVDFFNEGPVRWTRCYWLTCGLSIYRLRIGKE